MARLSSMCNVLPGRLDQVGQQPVEATRQHKIALDCLVVAVQEPRSVPGTASSVLASIKLGIANRGCVLDGRDHGRTKIVRGQGESGCEGCPDDCCWPRHDLGRGG